MLRVNICIESSCNLIGSYYVIKTFQDLIKENYLEGAVDIKASFCKDNCTKGISVKVNDKLIDNLTLENVEQKFQEYILSRFEKISA